MGVMLGQGARTQTACVRLTKAERDALAARYGTVTKALRALIRTALEKR